MTDEQLLTAARAGDEAAFTALVAPHRRGLYLHCYRLLGSPQDAEDALQDGLLRAWRGLSTFAGRSSVRSWLYAVATNAALRAAERRPPPEWVMPIPDTALAEDASYEERESVELAFLVALQLLPPRQRAVLILRDVLAFSGEETAQMLDTSPAAIYSALQRAHASLAGTQPERSQQATLRGLGDTQLRTLVDSLITAWDKADVDTIATLITEDVTFTMPPCGDHFAGSEAVLSFLRARPLSRPGRFVSRPTRANGQLAVVQHKVTDEGLEPHDVMVLDLDGPRIASFRAFVFADLAAQFASS